MVRKSIYSFLALALAVTLLLPSLGCAAELQPRVTAGVALQTRSAAASQAPTPPTDYYALHLLHLGYRTPTPAIRSGTWHERNSAVSWLNLEPKSGVYNWQTLDSYVALAHQEGTDVILELGQTPQWASSEPNQPGDCGAGAAAPPTSNTLWTNYVAAVATRYKGRIAYYEIWNQADGQKYWTGTPTQMLQLTALALKAIRSIDPHAKIIDPDISASGSDLGGSRMGSLKPGYLDHDAAGFQADGGRATAYTTFEGWSKDKD